MTFTLWLFNIAMEAMAQLWMIFPLEPPFMVGIFHGYVSHNQMVMECNGFRQQTFCKMKL
jgi:hypothetical protein